VTGARTIRLATSADAAEIHRIYAPIVHDTAISFEDEPPSVDEIARRIAATLERGLPWLVAEQQPGQLLGYAYASPWRPRAAYRWSVEVSVYVDPDAQRGGIGRALYASLFAVLALQGYCNAYAGATLPNDASVRLHEALGFDTIGVYPRIGYKHGAWHDTIWWAKRLRPADEQPAEPRHLDDVRADPGWRDALDAGARAATLDRGPRASTHGAGAQASMHESERTR
jgi:L-amino acid N-acyltransferase YncA